MDREWELGFSIEIWPGVKRPQETKKCKNIKTNKAPTNSGFCVCVRKEWDEETQSEKKKNMKRRSRRRS